MRLTDLTDEQITKLVKDIFSPKDITCIKRYKKDDHISVKIYTEWGDDKDSVLMADTISIYNPFDYGSDAIECDDGGFPISDSDIKTLKQFCYAHNIMGWLEKDNPYLEDEEEDRKI